MSTSSAAPTPSTAAAATAVAPTKLAIDLVTSSFTPNPEVNVEATGKPLPLTGSWGMQVKFAEGLPEACMAARLPCVRILYRVPESKVSCAWTVGIMTAIAPQPDGTIQHVTRGVVLDENADAARYTLKKRWTAGEQRPQPVATQRIVYPNIARDAGIDGVVTVRMVIGPDGGVKSVVPLDGPAVLQPAVMAAVRQWKYEPVSIGKQPTSFRIDKQFTFNVPKHMPAGGHVEGTIALEQNDPHYAPGFHSDGADGEQWQSCNTGTGCSQAAPPAPQ